MFKSARPNASQPNPNTALRGRLTEPMKGSRKTPKSLRRFIEKHLREWLAARGHLGAEAEQAEYDIQIQRRGEGHAYDCTMELRIGRDRFTASEFAPELHQALQRCLNHLIPVPPQPLRLALVTA